MTTAQQTVAMVFGAALAVVGVVLFAWRHGEGETTAKVLGVEVTIKTPSIVILTLGCVIFLSPFLPYFRADVSEVLDADGPASSPSGSTSGTSRMIDAAEVTVDASSELAPQPPNQYYGGNVLDGNPTTAWFEGVAGQGIGESITFRFRNRIFLTRIDILNGYGKSEDLFLDNSRIRGLTIETDEATFHLVLQDERELQSFRRPYGQTRTVTISIASVYVGRTYEDAGMSEIRFWRE